jgi:type IX secretion system PorP/SprF family membrane protein
MTNLHRLYMIVFLGLGVINLMGQDIHFSQFYMSPLNLNPAMTGVFNGTQRVVINYRNQWAGAIGSAAYNTYSASYDQRFAVGQEDFFGAGGTLWSDVAGDTKFGSTQARFSTSFSKKIAGDRKQSHYLTIGADVGMTQRRVRTGDLRWLTQVDLSTAEFCQGCGTQDVIQNNNFLFADISGGIMWFSNLGDRKNLYVGASLAHMNEPNVSFLGNQESLYSRSTIHAGGEYPMNNKISVKPNVIYMSQGPHKEFNAGASVRIKTKAKNAAFNTTGYFFELGGWYRVGNKVDGGIHSDAIILATRLDYDQYGIGFSYDYNVSDLGQSSPGNGSFELSLSYIFDNGLNRNVVCPVF